MVLCVGLNIVDTSCLPGPSSTLNVPFGNGRSTAILLTVDERRLRGGNRAGGMYAGAARSTYRDLRATRNLNGTRFAAAVGLEHEHNLDVTAKIHSLGLDKNTLVFFTTDNGAWQDVHPDAGYTPFRGTKSIGEISLPYALACHGLSHPLR